MGNSAALLTSLQIGSTGGLSSIKKISSDGNGFDNFSDLQEILHQKMYFASNFIFWHIVMVPRIRVFLLSKMA